MIQEKISAEEARGATRSYQMDKREALMAQTRARIVAAARELVLAQNALTGFSMELVARAAGVTRVTVYQRFGSKRGLLEALLDEIALKGHIAEHLRAAFAREDATELLRAFIEAFCQLHASERVLMRRLRAFGELDEEFGAALKGRDGRRRADVAHLLERLPAPTQHASENGASDERTRALMALTGFAFYDALAGDDVRGAADTLFALATAALELTA